MTPFQSILFEWPHHNGFVFITYFEHQLLFLQTLSLRHLIRSLVFQYSRLRFIWTESCSLILFRS